MDKFLGKASSFISGLGGNITLRCVARANVRNVVMRLHVYMYCGVCWWSWVILGLHAVSGWGKLRTVGFCEDALFGVVVVIFCFGLPVTTFVWVLVSFFLVYLILCVASILPIRISASNIPFLRMAARIRMFSV